jgi:hypothetical protein
LAKRAKCCEEAAGHHAELFMTIDRPFTVALEEHYCDPELTALFSEK